MTDLSKLKQSWMEGFEVVLGEDVETIETTEFSKLLSDSSTPTFNEGEVFKGKIVNISSDY